jgi:hypothetical protein
MSSTLRRTAIQQGTTFTAPFEFSYGLGGLGGRTYGEQLALFPEPNTPWEYAAVGGLKFKYAMQAGRFYVGHSRTAPRAFEELVSGFYEFAGTWFDPSSLEFVHHPLPWPLYGWSEEPTRLRAIAGDFSVLEDTTEAVWVRLAGVATIDSPDLGTGAASFGSTVTSQPCHGYVGSIGHSRQSLMDKINRAAKDGSLGGWDGYGAMAVSKQALLGARRFVDLLDPDIPDPEVTLGTAGEITFDWYRTQRMIFSISIPDEFRLHYAGLFGKNKISGTEEIAAALPESVRLGIKRVLTASG